MLDNISNWLTIKETCELLNIKEKTVKARCQSGKYSYKLVKNGKRIDYYINSDSIQEDINQNNFSEPQIQEDYSNAPVWAKVQAEKYISILKETQNLKGYELEKFINQWNISNPELKTSYPSVIKMRRRYNIDGLKGLLAKYGARANRTTVLDVYFDYFKTLYLKEGAPSLYSCWENTLGYAMQLSGVVREDFPSHASFKRRLDKEIPKQSIYLARYGKTAWNRKFGSYIERDYSNIICGKVWVSDHAQIDVACLTEDGNVVFPWVTAWRDYKSGKWLGWLLQSGSPNSDHIFQTFYYAAKEYGLPEDVIIDNGKDYRCKDFAGGRKNSIKISTNKGKTTSMLDELNVKVHFALPYNAQTKPIERDFLKIKELLSKHCVGYRGGNVVERPEKLIQEIKSGKIMRFEDFKKLFDDFILNVLNKKPSQGKNLQGLSPDELFNNEFVEKITTSNDALKLFCMRTSRNFTVGRNGIQDRQLGITYWADWMISKTGMKVYLRRDVQNYKEAWAFNSDNEEFVGKVTAVKAVAALHADKISKEEFNEAMAIKKRNLKVAKSYIEQSQNISIEEQCENYKLAYASATKSLNNKKVKVSKIANTNMDKVIRKNKEMEAFGKNDLSMFLDDSTFKEEPLYLFETDKILEEELKGVANAY
jgi:hypothetical protein